MVKWYMNQTTSYPDKAVENGMKTAVKKDRLPTSKKIATEWPQEVVELAGSWGDDFPSLQEIRSSDTKNLLKAG